MFAGGCELRRMTRTLALAGFVVCGASQVAWGQDWSLNADLSERGTYNSNLLLSPDHKINAFGSLTIPEFVLKRDSPTSSIALDGQFKFAEYFNHSELDSDSQLFNLKLSKDLSERSTVSFQGDFNRDTTLTSDEDLTGRFLTEPVRFITWDAAPTWSYQLSPIDTLTWDGSYLSTNYQSTLRTDYEYYGTDLSYEHQLSEVAAITGAVSYFRFVPDDFLHTRSDIYGALIGYRYAPTDRFLVSGSAGLDYDITHQDDIGFDTGDSTDLGYRVKFNMNYALNDQTKAVISLSHDVQPSGNGRLETQNRGTLTLNYQFGEKTAFSLVANYVDNQDYFGSGTGTNGSEELSRYFSVGPSLSWDITEDLKLQASYQLRHKIFEGDGGSATDNAAFLTIRYALPEMHWSLF